MRAYDILMCAYGAWYMEFIYFPDADAYAKAGRAGCRERRIMHAYPMDRHATVVHSAKLNLVKDSLNDYTRSYWPHRLFSIPLC